MDGKAGVIVDVTLLYVMTRTVVHMYYPEPDRSCLLHRPPPRPVVTNFEVSGKQLQHGKGYEDGGWQYALAVVHMLGEYTFEALVQFINRQAGEFVSSR